MGSWRVKFVLDLLHDSDTARQRRRGRRRKRRRRGRRGMSIAHTLACVIW
jgi:hypothetical protein